jgi:tripartite-type tricarboxylate transporter receptor subunit TctC
MRGGPTERAEVSIVATGSTGAIGEHQDIIGCMLSVQAHTRRHWEAPIKLLRREFLHLASVAAALPTISRIASAAAYPTRAMRLVVPFPPGGAADILARLLGQTLSDRFGQPCVIENRPGASSNIGTEAVVKAQPDGYTLLLVTPANAINATLYDSLGFNFMRDITPVASVVRIPLVMVVTPSFPAKTIPDFIAYAKANPGKLNIASGGNGTPTHVVGELFKIMAGIDMLHVPYHSDPIPDLLGGRVHVYFSPMPVSIEYIKAGKLRGLAVTTATRSEVLLDIPTVGEFVPGYEASAWFGVGAPKNTPTEIVDSLSKEINAGLADPKMKMRLADLSATVFISGSPAQFGKLISDETQKWGKVVKFARIKAE